MNGHVVTVSTHELKVLLVHAIKHRKSVLIVAKPGVGKSEIVGQACAETDSDLIIDYPAVSMPEDYKGFGFPDWDKKEAVFLPFHHIKKLWFIFYRVSQL